MIFGNILKCHYKIPTYALQNFPSKNRSTSVSISWKHVLKCNTSRTLFLFLHLLSFKTSCNSKCPKVYKLNFYAQIRDHHVLPKWVKAHMCVSTSYNLSWQNIFNDLTNPQEILNAFEWCTSVRDTTVSKLKQGVKLYKLYELRGTRLMRVDRSSHFFSYLNCTHLIITVTSILSFNVITTS